MVAAALASPITQAEHLFSEAMAVLEGPLEPPGLVPCRVVGAVQLILEQQAQAALVKSPSQ